MKKKRKTMFQDLANWLAQDAGDRSVWYKIRSTKKLFMLERNVASPDELKK